MVWQRVNAKYLLVLSGEVRNRVETKKGRNTTLTILVFVVSRPQECLVTVIFFMCITSCHPFQEHQHP